ncbi:putative glycolipid-binding domain-containing protein [Catellatospora sp. KI3]|uniref:putative glycolipid-binding domain-containing protein n=1 Tax=Catellatospora sp. KI3 TaxID=3041620 RepID=UPI0024828E34|nr:putative glycolipid-binding domain-containing protein [Catellatospora sp. KI3]MDI1465321.1 putative glycolipid-binding domain-containing protein [Catellatospora sp. KI3]
MRPMPRALLWDRMVEVGADIALVDLRPDRLFAHGQAVAAEPVAHSCRYELATGAGFATDTLTVESEGAGWQREVRLERSDRGWRVVTSEQGRFGSASLPGIVDADRLADAYDVDLECTALTNTLPIRRLNLLGAAPGTAHTVAVAWVRVPSLQVIPVEHTYSVVSPEKIRFTSGTFSAELTVDGDGFVVTYPGYAARVG